MPRKRGHGSRRRPRAPWCPWSVSVSPLPRIGLAHADCTSCAASLSCCRCPDCFPLPPRPHRLLHPPQRCPQTRHRVSLVFDGLGAIPSPHLRRFRVKTRKARDGRTPVPVPRTKGGLKEGYDIRQRGRLCHVPVSQQSLSQSGRYPERMLTCDLDFCCRSHHVFAKTSHKSVELAEVGPRFDMKRSSRSLPALIPQPRTHRADPSFFY